MSALSTAGWGRRGPRRMGRAVAVGALAGVLSLGSWAGAALGAVAVAADDGFTGDQAVVGNEVTVSGSGFGHGVGMSQFGALGMARAGASARAILTHYYTGTTVKAFPDNVDLRINVVDRGTSVSLRTQPLARGGGALQLVTAGSTRVPVEPGGAVQVTLAGDTLRVTISPARGAQRTFTTGALTIRWSGARGLAGPASLLAVTSRSANATATSGKERTYRWGALTLSPVGRQDSDGVVRTRIAGVALLNLHREYLRGLAEVPQGWPAAALRAQVVVARSYALARYRGGTSAVCGGCHLWDDTRSQVYRGWTHESVAPRWVAAVAATQTSRTHGLTVLHGRTPITAFYSSSSGGRTRDAGAVWGRSVPYLRSVRDPWSVDASVNPRYARWQRTVPRERLAALFGLPDIAAVAVSERDRSGAALTVTATAPDGTRRSLPGTAVRSKLRLPAVWFSAFVVPPPTPAG